MFQALAVLPLSRLEYRALGDLAVLEKAPQCDRETPCEGHDTYAPQPLAGTGKALVEPVAKLAAGLQAQPAPGEFNHQPAASFVARLADTLFNLAGATGVGRGRQAQATGQFPAVVKLSPAEQFPDQGPRAACTDARELGQQRHTGVRAAAHLPVLLHFERADLLAHQHEPLTFAVNLGAQTGRQQLALTGPPVRPEAAADIPDPKVVQHQQRADAVGVRGAFLPQAFELAVQAPVVLLLWSRDACDRPHPAFTAVIAHQHRQQLVAVKPVRLRATGTPVHLDTGRIHHEIDDALFCQPAVKPETVAPRLIATVDRRVGTEMAAHPGVRDAGENRRGVTRGNRAVAGRTLAITQRELPVLLTQFKGHVQAASCRRILPTEGCVRRIHLRAPSEKTSVQLRFTPVGLLSLPSHIGSMTSREAGAGLP